MSLNLAFGDAVGEACGLLEDSIGQLECSIQHVT